MTQQNTVAVIGVGRIGAVTAVGLAHLGQAVLGIDMKPARVEALGAGTLAEAEPGLRAALGSALQHRDLTFSTAMPAQPVDMAFLCVDTPPLTTGEPDLGQIFGAARSAAAIVRTDGILVTRSTIPVGTGDRIQALLKGEGRADIAVVHLPEFLREGSAWEDFREPDRVVVGSESAPAAAAVAAIFEPLGAPVFQVSRRSAELAKYLANAFLATSISFANEMADLCGAVDVDPATTFDILRADKRIGQHAYLTPGLGFGGHCLPKDTLALEHLSGIYGVQVPQLTATRLTNRGRLGVVVSWVRDALGSLDGKRICLGGLSFKPGTDDLRESPSLHLARVFALEGAIVTGWDPAVDTEVPFVECSDSLEDAAAGADALVIAHSWEGWDRVEPGDMAAVMRSHLVYDAPGVLHPKRWEAEGFTLNRNPAGTAAIGLGEPTA